MADFTSTMELDSSAKSAPKCVDQSTNFMCTYARTQHDVFTAGANLKIGNSLKNTFNHAHEKTESFESRNETSKLKKNDVHSNANFVTENI